MQLIRAKLFPPRLTSDLVPRPRLVQQLNGGLKRQLILVSAPAGFGKTTLLSEWAQQAAYPVAWVTLDANDDDLQSFLTYFVAAIETVYPHSCEQSQSLLTLPVLPPTPALVAILTNELALLAGEMILVLDDFHILKQIAIHDLLDALVPYLPPSFHLVLGTRSNPPLALVTLRARGQLCEVRQANLRFTPHETQSFFTQAGEIAPDEAVLKELDQHTEGWAAGLRLLLLSTSGYEEMRSFAARFSFGDADIMIYLTDQVLSKLPPALLNFLLCTAIVERFSLSLYALLAPESSSRDTDEALLAQCLADNLFVVTLGEGWYRYHPLFRELLLHRYERAVGKQLLTEQHRRASGWLEQNGLIDDAIRHALQAQDQELAVAVLSRHRLEAMNQDQWSRLNRWLALFPRALVEAHPILATTQVWIFNLQFKLNEGTALLERIKAQLAQGAPELEPATRQIVEGEICALSCEALYFQGNFQAVVASVTRALELLPIAHSKGRALAYHLLIRGRNNSGDWSAAQETLHAALAEAASHGQHFGPELVLIKAFLGALAQDPLAMEETKLVMSKWLQERALPESAFRADYTLGWMAYSRNELESAKEHFERVVTDRHVGHLGFVTSGYIVLALICQARGEEEKALHMMETAAAYVLESPYQGAHPALEAASALLALLQGRTSDGIAWAQSQVETPLLMPNIATTREASLVLLKALVTSDANENLSRAAALLPDYLKIARTTNARLITAELLALQARLCQHRGEMEAALAHLTEAINLVSRAHPLRLFADLGLENSRSLLPLLKVLIGRNVAPEYLAPVLELLAPLASRHPANAAQNRSSPPTPPAPPVPVEQLTQRELEILALIDQGLSNKEIAQTLYISDKTVENHTTNIYQKLGVRSRIQAARRANDLGLLPSR